LLEVSTRTVLQVLQDAARVHGDAAALHQPAGDGYLTLSWKQYLRAVVEIAAGLRSLGIGKGEVVVLNSETRLEFYLADIGTMANGSIAAALYPSYPPRTCSAISSSPAPARRSWKTPKCWPCSAARPCATGFCLPERRKAR